MRPTSLQRATLLLDQVEGDPLRTALVMRGIEAVVRVARSLNDGEVGQAVAADSNMAALVSALTEPGASELLETTSDPLSAARLRGVQARDELLALEGGTLGAEQVAQLTTWSRQWVDQRRREGKLLAVELSKRGFRYPAWQFADERPLPGLEPVLALLVAHPPLAQARFFLSGNHRLGGERPLDRLRAGDGDAVERAARAFGEQGAA